MTRRLPLPTLPTRVAGLLSVAVMLLTFSYLQAMYPRIPRLIPLRFEDGEPLIFGTKTAGLVYLPSVLQLSLMLIFSLVVLLLLWRTRPDSADTVAASDVARMRHAAEAVALLGFVWVSFQAAGAWRLVELWKRGYGGLGETYVVAIATAIAASVIVLARAIVRVRQEPAGAGLARAGGWRLGHYADRQQSALFVPVYAGLSPTVNFGRPVATILLVAALAVGLGGPFYLAWVAFRGVLGSLM